MAASTDNGMNFARGAAKTTMARSVRAWIIPDTGVFAPDRMLVAVLAMAPVAGSPPNNGERMFATPCPMSSTFGLCLSPLMRSETTADISDSIAPSMATVIAGEINGRSKSRRKCGSLSVGSPDGMPPKRVPIVSTGSLNSRTTAVPRKRERREIAHNRLNAGKKFSRHLVDLQPKEILELRAGDNNRDAVCKTHDHR